jgi:hypothetical protein
MKRFPARLLLLSFLWLGAASALAADAPGGSRPAEATTDLTPIPFDSVTTARYRETAGALAKAMATDDAKAFRALHTDAGWAQADDWWQGMLANQKKKFGPVVRAYGPLRGSVRAGTMGVGVPRDGAAVLLILEKNMGAAMSFTLDADGRIVKSSLWVQGELAGADTQGAELLWEAPKKGAKP